MSRLKENCIKYYDVTIEYCLLSACNIVCVYFQLCILWHHVDSLKPVTMGVFTPYKFENANIRTFCPMEIQLLTTFHHITNYDWHKPLE